MTAGGAATLDLGPADLSAWLERATSAHPTKPYLVSVEDERILTYRELHAAARRIAAHFAALGIGRNERVVVLAGNSLEYLALYIGALASGVTICTVHVEANAAHLRAIVASLAPRLAIYEEGIGIEPQIEGLGLPACALGRLAGRTATGFFAGLPDASAPSGPSAASPRDDAVICYTSGTTARPKGVVLSYREMLANSACAADAFGIGAEDRIYDCRSFSWASAQLLGALAPLSRGATLLLRKRFSRSRFFADIARHGATIAAGNPTIINMLLLDPAADAGAAATTLRFVTSSSAPLLADAWRRFEERFGIPVIQGYGSSETGWIAASREEARRFGSAGRPLPYQRLAILGPDGRALPAGEIGSVEVGGFPGNAYRYIADDGSIAVHSVGRIRTGDAGYLDADGYLHLTGRERDLIIRGGVNISPVEIDSALVAIEGVAEAATIGVPDPIYGEEVVGYVVLAPHASLTPDEIAQECARRVPAFKAPKRIVIRDSLPKSDRGKLDRKALAREYANKPA